MIQALANEPRSREQIATTAGIIRDVLGDAALAAYLYGSAVSGGLRPTSDLDILVLVARSLTREERLAIVHRLLPISGPTAKTGPGRHLEVSIVSQPSLTPWSYPPSIELQYGDWMRDEFERGELPDWPRPDPDVTVLLETARRASVALFGSPFETLVAPVPRADLKRSLLDTVPVLMPGIEEGDDRRNGLLTLARVWMTLATGEIAPKDEAASWALARLPEQHRPVLAHARSAYLGEEVEDWTKFGEAQVLAHVQYVVTAIGSVVS